MSDKCGFGSKKKYKAYVLPFVIDKSDQVCYLFGVRKKLIGEIERAKPLLDQRIPYVYYLLGGDCGNKQPNSEEDWKRCALRELCEETLEYMSFNLNDLIDLNPSPNPQELSEDWGGKRKCIMYRLYGLPLKTTCQVIDLNTRTFAVGKPCFENNFLRFVKHSDLGVLMNNQMTLDIGKAKRQSNITHFKDEIYDWFSNQADDWQANLDEYQKYKEIDRISEGFEERTHNLLRILMEQRREGIREFLRQFRDQAINYNFTKKQKPICNCRYEHLKLQKNEHEINLTRVNQELKSYQPTYSPKPRQPTYSPKQPTYSPKPRQPTYRPKQPSPQPSLRWERGTQFEARKERSPPVVRAPPGSGRLGIFETSRPGQFIS